MRWRMACGRAFAPRSRRIAALAHGHPRHHIRLRFPVSCWSGTRFTNGLAGPAVVFRPFPCSGPRRCSWSRCPRSGAAGSARFRHRAVRADFAAAFLAHGRRHPRHVVHRRGVLRAVHHHRVDAVADVRPRRPVPDRDRGSLLYLVVGAFGVPFVLAVLIVAYQDLELREQERRGVRT